MFDFLQYQKSELFDQNRLHLASDMAASCRRVWGVIGSLRQETVDSANATTPASAQVALRVNWLGEGTYRYRDFFVRSAAFSAAYSPRLVTGKSCNLRIGDIATGAVERPRSVRNSTEIAQWDFGTLEEWRHFSPHTVIEASHFNAIPADFYDLPQLWGGVILPI